MKNTNFIGYIKVHSIEKIFDIIKNHFNKGHNGGFTLFVIAVKNIKTRSWGDFNIFKTPERGYINFFNLQCN